MPNNNTFFYYNNTHQNTTQTTDYSSTLTISLGIIATVAGMILFGAYCYLHLFEQNRVAPRQPPAPPHDPETRYEVTLVIPFNEADINEADIHEERGVLPPPPPLIPRRPH